MNAYALIVGIAIACASSVSYADEEKQIEGTTTRDIVRLCNDEGMCLIKREDYEFLRDGNRLLAKKLRAYEHPPECAKTEITEPSKNAPKKLPPIPRENDS